MNTRIYLICILLILFLPCSSYSDQVFVKSGLASWYGSGHHGNRTASGDKFDMNVYTAAHKTLEFGTKVKVLNIDNGRMVVVTINDRGPYVKGRIIDLSKSAASQLGCMRKGICRVKLEIVQEN
jgi:rare lipoprotein A